MEPKSTGSKRKKWDTSDKKFRINDKNLQDKIDFLDKELENIHLELGKGLFCHLYNCILIRNH